MNSFFDNSFEIIEVVNRLLHEAIIKRASDIHFEPYQDQYRIRMRIDGILQTMDTFSLSLAKQITARLKIMAKLNIAEQRRPQDGQLTFNKIAMRISSLPVITGEKVVLRVLDKENQRLLISQLGLDNNNLSTYQRLLKNPQGLILVTGPTGSGKTVTLYSGLNEIEHDKYNICSIEDPIEIPLMGINQTQVNIKAGLDFAQTLRAFLRQDPDVIMVGEIRDKETAQIAIQAAQTGHLVLSTLHTNSSVETLIRLTQMGIANYQIAASLKLIIAQRLVRKLCTYCKIACTTPLILHNQPVTHFVATGCSNCLGGYRGRTGIYEFLEINDQMQAALLTHNNYSQHSLNTLIKRNKVKTLLDSAIELIKQGVTSFSEIERVLGVDCHEEPQ